MEWHHCFCEKEVEAISGPKPEGLLFLPPMEFMYPNGEALVHKNKLVSSVNSPF